MRGFLKKDLALLYNTGKVYLAVIAMGIVLGLVNKEMRSFSSSFIMIMLALLHFPMMILKTECRF